MLQLGMQKQKAIQLLGGSVSKAAEAMGVTYQAVSGWPDELPARIAERVMGVYAKDKLPELATPTDTPHPATAGQG